MKMISSFFRTIKILACRVNARIEYGKVIPEIVSVNQPNSESNDCSIRALLTVKGYSYRNARKKVEAKGRVRRDGIQVSDLCRLMKSEGVKSTHILSNHYAGIALTSSLSEFSTGPCITLIDFMKTHPNGRYLIVIDQHAMALVDGILYGNGNERSKHLVHLAFEF